MTDYLLVEPSSLEDLKAPLRGSARLKYTCFDVSSRYIAVGSNTGSVYIFDKNSLRHLQVVFTEEEPSSVNNVKLCASNKTVAFSMINGLVQVMELNIDKRQKPERLRSVSNHLHRTVSCIHWDPSGQKLYTADNIGNVVVANIPSSKMKNLVQVPVEVILNLSVPVIQLDFYQDKLLVSTRTECFLCNTAKHNYLQIGTKPRDGVYGACFLQSDNTVPIMYCARPGSRLWEVDIEGNVQHTHQFKQLLAIPPVHVLSIRDNTWRVEKKEFPPLGINFPVLKCLSNKFILTWNKTKLILLDPLQEQPKVILWTEFQTDILEAGIHGTEIYVFLTSGEILKLMLMSASQTVSVLVSRKLWELAAQVCGTYSQSIMANHGGRHLSRKMLKDLVQNIHNGCQSEHEGKVMEIFEKISAEAASSSETEGSEYSRSRSSSGASIVRLDSGIYQIKNSKSSASLDSWNETGSQDEVDSGTSSPVKLPSGTNEVIVNIVDEDELEKDLNSNDKSKQDQERCFVDTESSEQMEKNQDMPVCTINGGHVEVESSEVENHTELNKESLNRLINSDDIFADDEILIPRGSIKLATKKPKLNGDLNEDSFEQANSSQNGLVKDEIIDIVSVQDQDLIPLIVKKSESDGQRKSSTRKKAVTVDIDGRKPKDEKHRRRNSRSKLKETDREHKKQESSHSSKEMISNSAPIEYLNSIPVTQSNSFPLKRTESCPAMTEKPSLIQPNAAEIPSPSASPLSQSWEEPTKMTLTSVKGSLQSKFANTKKKFLDTIKEKKRISSSPKDSKESRVQIQVTSSIPEEQELKQDIPLSDPVQESPILGLNEFIQKTVKTRAKLQDFSVMLNPDAFWETLADWMISMNTVMKNLNTQKYLKVLQSKHSERCRLRLVTESSKEENKSDVMEDVQTALDDTEKDKEVMDTECEQPSSPMLELSDFEKFSVQDFCNVEDPLQLSSEMFTLVKDLTRQCFNSRCFNNIVGSIEPDLGAISFCDICPNCYQTNETNIASVFNTSVRLSGEHMKTDVFGNPGDKGEGISSSSILESVVNTQGPCKSTVNENSSVCDTEENNFLDSSHCEVSEHGISNIRSLGMNGVTALDTSDIAASVRCYFFLLDKIDLIQSVYLTGSTLSQDDKFQVWTAWMQSLQVKNEADSSLLALDKKSKDEAISMLELSRHDQQRALFSVYKLFKRFPVETVSFCVKCDHLQPVDIVYLCQHYQQDENVLLDQYMCGRFVELQSSRRLLKSNLIMEERVAQTWLRTLLGKTVISKQLKDEDGNPWLSSHCVAWEDRDKVDFILLNISEDHREKCFSMCTESGYWRGCLILLKKQQKWREMATMIFCLGDLQLFSEMDLLPETISDWKSFVELFQLYSDNHQKKYHSNVENNSYRNPTAHDNSLVHKEASDNQSSFEKMSESSDLHSQVKNSDISVPNTPGKESPCGDLENKTFHERKSESPAFCGLETESLTHKETTEFSDGPVCGGGCISLGEVASLMLQHLDESVCVGIWTEMEVAEGCIDQSVYQSSITTALNHRHQRNVMHNLLEKIDSYLWAKKPNTLMPELQYAVSVERKSRGSRKERTNEQLMTLLSEKPADGRRYMEDSECHWGITTNILKCCRMCNISLSESISHVEPGILVFDCGHGFHKYCCQGRVCQLCS